jgi:hypothetical protein
VTSEAHNSGLSPEQLEVARLGWRLESIFMPHAMKQREEAAERLRRGALSSEEWQLRCAHYTTAESALRIIQTKRIWMRNTTCMADYREVQHGFEIFSKFFSDKKRVDDFVAALDGCVPGVAQEAMTLFKERSGSFLFDTYITSISEHDYTEDAIGRLSMWRAFGGGSPSVAIVLKIPKYSAGAMALNLLVSPVAYLNESEAHAAIYAVINNVKDSADFLRSIDRRLVGASVFGTLLAGIVCLKHPGFREEVEWRSIYVPNLTPSTLMKSSTQVCRGVPQRVFMIPLDATADPVLADLDFSRLFDRLIIGPSQYPWVMYSAFTEALAGCGVTDADKRVFVSDIPIRT